LLKEAIDAAFLEDKAMLEGQHRNLKDRPNHPTMAIVHDAGPGKMLWVLDKMLKAEEATRSIPIATSA
jgi:vanillate O-demethylase monooxygenase subunit